MQNPPHPLILGDQAAHGTRNYAKRQLTWFRGVEEAQWKLADNLTVEEIFTSIKKL